MVFTRTTFFVLLVLLLLMPVIGSRLWWLASARKARATTAFAGKEISGQLVRNYSVMMFSVSGSDTVFFNTGNEEIYQPGSVLPILYQPKDPTNARVNRFWSIWMDSIVIGGVLASIWLIVFLHPAIVPYRSKVEVLLRRPFIRII